MRKGIDGNRTFVIFLIRCTKYLSILAVLVAMVSPLYFKSYDLAKQLTIDKSNSKLKEGIKSFESQIIKAQEITNLLQQEEVFKRIFFLKGTPSSEYYYDINILQSKLRSLSLTQDLISNIYIVFKDNPIFISNYFASDSFLNIYDRFYGYEGVDVQAWRDLLFNKSAYVKFLPTRHVHSAYYSQNYFQSVTAVMDNSYFNAFDHKSVMVIDFDYNDLVEQLLYNDQLTDHFVYIADQDNNLLFSHNYAPEMPLNAAASLDEVTLSAEDYILLTLDSNRLGLSTVIGIPVSSVQRQVYSLLQLVMLYVAIGSALIVMLSLLYSLKETLWVQKVNIVNQEQLGKIEALNDSIKQSVLKNLLITGVFTEKEREEAERYFRQRFDNFCVAKVSCRIDDPGPYDQSIESNAILEIESAFRSIGGQGYMSLNLHANESIIVIFFDGDEPGYMEEMRGQLTELVRDLNARQSDPFVINIGLSLIVNGLMEAKLAYRQAIDALSTNENGVSSGVYLYEPRSDHSEKRSFDLAVLLKLNDAILSGERKIVSQIYTDSLDFLSQHASTEQERLQIFFSFRQTVFNARQFVLKDKSGADQTLLLSLPEYDRMNDVIRLFQELQQVSERLCELVIGNKRSNNEKLKSDIISYIHSHFADVSLSAHRIAEQLLISEKYVFSFVKEQTGKSLGKFIEETRVAQAERLLLETDYANSKILQMCGFGSENTFYRAFAKKHAVSPTVWKENNRQSHRLTGGK